MAGSLLLGGASGVFAAGAKAAAGTRAHAVGLVSNLSATGFTLTRTSKAAAGVTPTVTTTQVSLAATTRERGLKGTTGALANGEYALVIGQKTGSGITAQRVIYAANARSVRRLVRNLTHVRAGTVNAGASTPTTLMIATKAGKTLSFTITSTTRFRVNKQLTTTAPIFTQGEKVRVLFKRDKTTRTNVAVAIAVPAQATA